MFLSLHPISRLVDFATKFVESDTFPGDHFETFSDILSEADAVLGLTISRDLIDAVLPILDPFEVMRAKSSQCHQFVHDSPDTPNISVTKYGKTFLFPRTFVDFKLLLQN